MEPDVYPAVVVYERAGAAVTAADQAQAAADAKRFAGITHVSTPIAGPIIAKDGRALQIIVPIKVGRNGVSDTTPAVKAIRSIVKSSPLNVYVTGAAGYAADSLDAVSGIDATLLYLTLAIVIAILLFTYRSPVLWVLPLMCVVVALTVSQGAVYLFARYAGLTVNSDSQFLLTVLVLGAGTDYALLLIARYREELRRHEDRHEAMAVALHRAGPAIIASGTTVPK